MPRLSKQELVARLQQGLEICQDLAHQVNDPAVHHFVSNLSMELDHRLFDLLQDDDSPDDDEFVLELRSGDRPRLPFNMQRNVAPQSQEQLESILELVNEAQQYSAWSQRRKRP